MKFYRLDAECVRSKEELLSELSKKQIEVMLSGTDPTFDSMYTIVIRGQQVHADSARDLVWKFNGGAFCGIKVLSEDEYDELC